jgi:RNA polymerase sigma-70 factor (ECF subfamily)
MVLANLHERTVLRKEATYPHEELIARCRDNDRQAQRELYQLYVRPMFNVCYRIVNQQEEAEDVLQEAFVRMFRQLDTYRQEASFGSWFKRIVVNASLNHIKKRQLKWQQVERMHGQPQETVLQEEENSVEMERFSVQQVQQAMEALPEGYRLVFNLYLFEDWTHREIAGELGISESTSKSQLNRAKKKMKELLIQQSYEKN